MSKFLSSYGIWKHGGKKKTTINKFLYFLKIWKAVYSSQKCLHILSKDVKIKSYCEAIAEASLVLNVFSLCLAYFFPVKRSNIKY